MVLHVAWAIYSGIPLIAMQYNIIITDYHSGIQTTGDGFELVSRDFE